VVEVDFSDFKSALKWFDSQRAEVRCTITSRMALRVLANVGRLNGDDRTPVALACLRATLASAVRGLGRTTDLDRLKEAA